MTQKELQDEMTLTLRHPITLGEGIEAQSYSKLDLREPLAEEVLDFNRRSGKDAGDALRYLIAKVSGVPLAVIGKMRARDFTKASSYLMDFLNPEIDEPEEGDDSGK
ncbi:MAG: phage tail assembly protein [Castellaniella sp.]|nr:phage tail assembly protein [Castellaniella sp.]